jgi:Dolichyl-phosphate-mannose-protein mannosyltransferase
MIDPFEKYPTSSNTHKADVSCPPPIYLPQALSGVLSVLLLYYLVRRHFGVVAGLLAAARAR